MVSQSRTGDLLHADHMATIAILQELEDMLAVKAPPKGGEGFLKRLSTTLRNEVERHFAFEENHLFPLFGAAGGMVGMLVQEHRAILPLALGLADMADAGAWSGFDAAVWQDFRRLGLELIEREVFHIQKEEMGLLAAISIQVDSASDQRLAALYRQAGG